MPEQVVIFTDMDGTLLDHYSYSHKPAIAMLETLKQRKIPVIPTTSKTFAELSVLRDTIGLSDPFIVENGAAVYIPQRCLPNQPSSTKSVADYWLKEFTSPRDHWLALLKQAETKFAGCFEQFSNMSSTEICQATGLDLPSAERAAQRQYSEPVLWLGTDIQAADFVNELTKLGARPLQGGRFIHVCGNCDKGIALRWLVDEYSRQYPATNWLSIALGDSNNDIAMLETADIAVRILSPSNELPQVNRTANLYTSSQTGPAGWNECLTQILATHL